MTKSPSILIVDDNVGLCKTMAFILKRKGYVVETANNGPEALEKVQEKPFDMIFMDVKMPVMDGVQTYKRIKQIRPDAVVMMMTAYSVEDLVQETLEKGAYGIIYKPLDIEKAISVVEASRQTRKGGLILVVDDDPSTCTTLKNILAARGHQVNIAHTGEEAVRLTEKSAHDVILIDMKLPTINGLETYLAIKERHSEAVVIMMTAYRQEMASLVEEALQNNAYTCLYKPFEIAELIGIIWEIIERKRKTR